MVYIILLYMVGKITFKWKKLYNFEKIGNGNFLKKIYPGKNRLDLNGFH